MTMKKIILSVTAILFLTGSVFAQKFSVSYPDSLLKRPFTGQILVYLSKNSKEPKTGMAGLDIFPCVRLSVKNIKANAPVIIDDKAIAFPVPLSDMERGEYNVQVVWDRNLGGRSISESPGNLYSASQKVKFTKNFAKVYAIKATKVVPEPLFKNTAYAKEIKAPSALLTIILTSHHCYVRITTARRHTGKSVQWRVSALGLSHLPRGRYYHY